jgi:cell fate (sporulation/competence/biofilm development) regulator YlbF (YheA/YmcA/DUF963 family)
MNTIKEQVEELVEAIQKSDVYQEYLETAEQVRKVPGLEEKIRDYRLKNYELQTSEVEDLYERMEEFERQYSDFRKDPLVSLYLERELRVCRMLQSISTRITESVDLMI